jgi:16S rRNA (adenine1518-N6/adenine1519-N6)-dimethyltransferase
MISNGMRPKKSLGQNFLRSERALSAIIDAGDVKADDIVLEIGPGEGVLTERLLELSGKVIAVEKDDALFERLQENLVRYIALNKLDLIHDDILNFDPDTFSFYKDLTYKLVANIPYNITGAIFKKFLSAETQPKLMVLLVQKEVAERIVARDKKESILSISIKCYGKPKYIETVKAGSFVPVPKVDSAILLIEDISKDFFQDFAEGEFFEMVRAGFSSKRKKLSSNLAGIYPKERVEEVFASLGLDTNIRAEDIDIDMWQKLGRSLLE